MLVFFSSCNWFVYLIVFTCFLFPLDSHEYFFLSSFFQVFTKSCSSPSFRFRVSFLLLTLACSSVNSACLCFESWLAPNIEARAKYTHKCPASNQMLQQPYTLSSLSVHICGIVIHSAFFYIFLSSSEIILSII